MTNFKEVFQNKHVVLPVVHVETGIQTLKNAHIAFKAGADGVFLISMNGMNHYDLLQIQKFPVVFNKAFYKSFGRQFGIISFLQSF